jgi:ferredoxin-NADP reductase
MPPCKAILKSRKRLCNGTTAFSFERPYNFDFKAGQFINLTLLDGVEADLAGSTRSLTIASGPREPDVMVAMRNRHTSFKTALQGLPLGSPVLFQGPFGNFTLDRDIARPAAFLAGGIGITPFRSMLWQATTARSPVRIVLFYANRRPEEAAFLEELRAYEEINPNFKLVATMTRSEQRSDWQGEKGHFTTRILRKWLPDLRAPIFYLAGPAAAVTSMRLTLDAAGVSGNDIRTEEFPGY